jgi:hypothetical protein
MWDKGGHSRAEVRDMDDALDTSDLNLGAVSTYDDLAALLQEVYVRADKPSRGP